MNYVRYKDLYSEIGYNVRTPMCAKTSFQKFLNVDNVLETTRKCPSNVMSNRYTSAYRPLEYVKNMNNAENRMTRTFSLDQNENVAYTPGLLKYQTDEKLNSCTLENTGSCQIGGGCGNNKNILPVLDPRFNFREIVKQLVLLETHLFNEGQRCVDCTKKHTLTIEAFMDEAISLDTEMKYIKSVEQLRKDFKDAIKDISNCKDLEYCNLAQKLRVIRKKFVDLVGDFTC